MRYFFFILCILCACSQPKATQKSTKASSLPDDVISLEDLVNPAPKGALDWTNMVQLMESLANLPFEQRSITLKTIKEEAIKLGQQTWPDEWNNNPTRSRYNVFLTHLSIAADQRLGEDPVKEQAASIEQMKKSWDVFVQHSTLQESTVLDTAAN